MPVTVRDWTGTAAAGLWRMEAGIYHADPCPKPSLSRGALKTLLDESPYHAYSRHPKLGGNVSGASRRLPEIGSVTHKLALGVGAEVAVLDFGDYKTKAAREARSEAESAGLLPILAHDHQKAVALSEALREALEGYLGMPVDKCLREVAVLWEEDGFWRRAMIDVMTPDLRRVADLKTTGGSAAPAPSTLRLFDQGYDLQAAHYTRGLDAIDPDGAGRRTFGFIFAEQDFPHAISPPLELSEGARTIAEQKREIGTALWDSCLRTGQWPGYSAEVQVAEPPPWVIQRWALRMENDETLNPVEG